MTLRIDMKDILFALEEHVQVENLLSLEKFKESSMDDFRMLLDEASRMAEEVLAPTNEIGDKVGAKLVDGKVQLPPELVDAYQKFTEAGWPGMGFPEELGGQPVPRVINYAVSEMLVAGNCSFMMYPGLARGVAEVLLHFADAETRARYVPPIVEGRWGGTMCLTEPQAGSAVGDLTTKATRNGDHFLIEGTKIFISAGDHDLTENIVHLVLARIEGDEPGTRGISIFVVPKFLVNEDGSLGEPNGVRCESIEDKMGIKASATCVMKFGESQPCVGYLIGEERKGMRIMFHLMNEARILTGQQGQAIAAAAYYASKEYAKERVQGTSIENFKDANAERVTIINHPDVRRMLLHQKALVEGLRAMFYKTAYYLDLSENSTDEDIRENAQDFVDLLTPICKAFGSDMGFRATELAIQTFGGYGYIKDYPVEQYMRDCKIASVYEGTNGIQALDLLGRKLGSKGGRLVMRMMELLDKFTDGEKDHPSFGKQVGQVANAKDRLLACIMSFGSSQAQGDFTYPALSAVPFLHMFGYVVVGWMLLEQGIIAEGRLHGIYFGEGAGTDEEQAALLQNNEDAAFYHNKVQTARFFIAHLLPQVHALADGIESEDRGPLAAIF